MCVILHSIRKKNLMRSEVSQAMKHNNDGFFMCHWPNGSKNKEDRKYIRTLNEDDALGFFDRVPDDDVFVMHARIPSRGEKTLENVHGWDEDGIMFCHNMTMTSLSGLMKSDNWTGTDSEYFFRKLFMPMHKGEHLADPSLGSGEMGPATKRLTSLLCGDSNKFLFIMPDNTVIRAGNWSTIASEKRVIQEEREIDEVVGESIDINGKVEKKIKKVKRTIAVERELAVAVASNTYYRSGLTSSCGYRSTYSGATSTYDDKSSGRYGSYSGYGKDSTFGSYEKSFYDEDNYDIYDGYSTYCKDYYGKQKKKAKKQEVSDLEVKSFIEWRNSLPGNAPIEKITQDDLNATILFDNDKAVNGGLSALSFIHVFEMMLRCIVYHSYRDNISIIREADSLASSDDILGMTTIESERILSEVIPSEFDKTTAESIIDLISGISDAVKIDISSGKPFKLPSEIVREVMVKAIQEMENQFSAASYLEYATQEYGITEKDISSSDLMKASFEAIDKFLNLSFDHTVKANKDIEKFVKAGLVVDRKLRWITPAMLLSADSKMINSSGNWIKSKKQDDYVNALNILAEACVTAGESLEREDRRYVAELKALGFDFTKKGSKEIFVPGNSIVDAEVIETSADKTKATQPANTTNPADETTGEIPAESTDTTDTTEQQADKEISADKKES